MAQRSSGVLTDPGTKPRPSHLPASAPLRDVPKRTVAAAPDLGRADLTAEPVGSCVADRALSVAAILAIVAFVWLLLTVGLGLL